MRARPLNRVERAYRWCRRNSTLAMLLVAAAGLLLLSGVAGTLTIYHFRLQAALAGEEGERQRAEDALAKANRYLYFNRIYLAGRAYGDLQMNRATELIRDADRLVEKPDWEWHYLKRVTEAYTRQYDGHTRSVRSLAVPGHGQFFITGGDDRLLNLWPADSNLALHRIAVHKHPISGLSISPDAKRLASVDGAADAAGELIVWSLSDDMKVAPRELYRVPGVWERAAVAFHPTAPTLALSTGVHPGEPGRLVILDQTGRELHRLETALGEGYVSLAWSPDGRTLAAVAATGDAEKVPGRIDILDAEIRQVGRRLVTGGGSPTSAAFSPNGELLAASGTDGTIRSWGTESYAERPPLRGHTGPVEVLAFAPNGTIVSGGKDTTVRVWDPAAGRLLVERRGHSSPVTCVAANPVTGELVSGAKDMTVLAWRPTGDQDAQAIPLHRGKASIAFSRDGSFLVSAGADGAVWRTDPRGKTAPKKLHRSAGDLAKVLVLPDGETLVLARESRATEPGGAVTFVDARDGTPRGDLPAELVSARSLSVSPDGRWLAVVGDTAAGRSVVQVWDLVIRSRVQEVDVPRAVEVTLLADGTRAFVVIDPLPDDEKPQGWTFIDVPSGRRFTRNIRLGSGPRFAQFTADGSTAFLGGRDRSVQCYQVTADRFNLHYVDFGYQHSASVNGMCLSPDGRRIATAGDDHTVRLWDSETASELLVLPCHPSPVTDVTFSPTGGYLAASQADGTIWIWDGTPKSMPSPSQPRQTTPPNKESP
ncbi:MAG: hypothetical protein U0871_15125 [Gemmataceae bacterium]